MSKFVLNYRNINKIQQYRQVLKFFDCANFIYTDQIKDVNFKKISNYKKSRNVFMKVYNDFLLVNELLDRNDIINSATILRELYENIIYIIATSFDNTLKVTLDSQPKEFRKVLENNCDKIFSDNVYPDSLDYIYKYLCKIVHPSNFKEFMAYIENNALNRKYVINCIKFVMITIEFIFLDFVNKKTENDSSLNESVFDICGLVNLFNATRMLQNSRKSNKIARKYLLNDLNNKYLKDKQLEIQEFGKFIKDNSKDFDRERLNIINRGIKNLENSKYIDSVKELLKL